MEELEVKEVDAVSVENPTHGITIMPANFRRPGERVVYHSAAISFYKIAKPKFDIAFLTEPNELLVQKSIDVFLPTFYLALPMLVENPALVQAFIETVVEFVKGTVARPDEANVHLSVVTNRSETPSALQFDYKGSVAGLAVMQDALKKALDIDK